MIVLILKFKKFKLFFYEDFGNKINYTSRLSSFKENSNHYKI
jgi:hypothetical protein